MVLRAEDLVREVLCVAEGLVAAAWVRECEAGFFASPPQAKSAITASALSNVLAMGPPSWRVGSNIRHDPTRQVPQGTRAARRPPARVAARPLRRVPGASPGALSRSR